MAKKQSDKNPFEKLTFEQAVEALGGIVQKIETGQVPLEESLRQYEQGMAMIQHCRNILLDAEKRIEVIHESMQPQTSSADRSEDEDLGDDEDSDIEDDAENPADAEDEPEDDSLF